jgi:dihydropteroate synthase
MPDLQATPWVRRPSDAASGIPARPPAPLPIGRRTFEWGSRTYVMGIINVTPDSFSGDGLLGGADKDPLAGAVAQARRMAAEGADLLDIGGASSRPGHVPVPEDEEARRVVPVVGAIRAALPEMPLSIDTVSPVVAEQALDAGADMLNDIWAVGADDAMARLAGRRGTPMVLMHNRAEARYTSVVAEVLADLARAIERALAHGVALESLIVDPGIGFGKTAEQNLQLLAELEVLTTLGRPILLGTSRKSTIGKVLDLPPAERLSGTLATTALGIAAGVDIVRVHDVEANVRAARMSDAIVRGGWIEDSEQEAPG